jgi:hypothetical protein
LFTGAITVITVKDTSINGRRKRPGRKRKIQVFGSEGDENKQTETPWFSENIETGK